MRPVDPNELVARSLTQIRRKHCNDRLRASVQQTIELAVTDDLTGLHNRRYLENHLKLLIDRAGARGRPLSICITDIDRFKRVNDTYGHDAVGAEIFVAGLERDDCAELARIGHRAAQHERVVDRLPPVCKADGARIAKQSDLGHFLSEQALGQRRGRINIDECLVAGGLLYKFDERDLVDHGFGIGHGSSIPEWHS